MNLKKIGKICIFGAGKNGAGLAQSLKYAGTPFFFVDNDSKKQQKDYMGAVVLNPTELHINKNNCLIVVACAESNYAIIEKQLISLGLERNSDFVRFNYFMNQIVPRLVFENTRKNFMSLCQISLTERCTLKCRKCAHACYATESSCEDMSLTVVYKSADSFFSHIDMIHEFVLIGGEPLLYKNLDAVIYYIGEKYRKRIHIFSVTTNGTLVPSDEVLEKCRQYDVSFRISNYAKQLPWIKERQKKLTDTLNSYGIHYSIAKEETQWMDYGFETVDRKASPEELRRVFHECRTPCHEVRGNRLYYCVMARSVAENLHLNVGQNDYLDLDSLRGEEGKETLLKFTLGEFEKGYLDMCNYCHGADSVNFPIPAAEQVISASTI